MSEPSGQVPGHTEPVSQRSAPEGRAGGPAVAFATEWASGGRAHHSAPLGAHTALSEPPGSGAHADEGCGPAVPVTIQLPPHLRSVGQARSKLRQLALVWGCSEAVLEDASVVLSELLSNGILHARTDLEVVLSPLPSAGVRIEVHDASPLPIVPPLEPEWAAHGFLEQLSPGDQVEPAIAPTATGRGLSMVKAMATTWGWYPQAGGGKVVWAELGTTEAAENGQGGSFFDRLSYQLRPVRVIAAPFRLLKASEDHFDDLLRELQMVHLSGGPGAGPMVAAVARAPAPSGSLGNQMSLSSVAADLAPLADHVKGRLGRMREPMRRAIWEAVRRGDRLVDLDLLADSGTPAAFEMLEDLLARAATAARLGFLLTEPPAPEVVAWRQWLRQEIEGQVGGRPPRACPFPVSAPHDETSAPTRDRLDAARRVALAELRSVLSSGGPLDVEVPSGSPEDAVMVSALECVLSLVGARRSVLCILADNNETVNFGASVGFSPTVAEYWRAYSLSADLPGSEAIRTGRPVFFRTFAELHERYPVFLTTPSESDPALACVPLVADTGPPAVAALVLGFAQARDFSARERSFLGQLASELARHMASQRNRAARRRLAARTKSLQRAAAAMKAAHTEHEVLSALVEVVVASVADGAAAHVRQADGRLRYVLAHHRDPGREEGTVALFRRQGFAGERRDLLVECATTGERSVFQRLTEEAVAAAVGEEDAALLSKLGVGSAGIFPLRGRGGMLGVLSFVNDIGRFITEGDIAAVQVLADQAGSALAALDAGPARQNDRAPGGQP